MNDKRGSDFPEKDDRGRWNGPSNNDHSEFFRKQIYVGRDGSPYGTHPAKKVKQVDIPKKEPAFKVSEQLQFEVDVVRLADQIVRLVTNKQKDYGPNNIQRSPFGALEGITIRIYDKVSRSANLIGKKNAGVSSKPQFESLRDTYMDLAGYAIIALLLLEGKFPEGK